MRSLVLAFLRRLSRQATVDVAIHQTLPSESRLEGKLTFSGGLHIQGHVQGTLTPQGLHTGIVVDEAAQVFTENLEADTILIKGQVTAQTVRAQRIVLTGTARVTGALDAAEVEIQNGALFDGRVSIQRPMAAESKAKAVSAGSATVAKGRLQEALGASHPTQAELA